MKNNRLKPLPAAAGRDQETSVLLRKQQQEHGKKFISTSVSLRQYKGIRRALERRHTQTATINKESLLPFYTLSAYSVVSFYYRHDPLTRVQQRLLRIVVLQLQKQAVSRTVVVCFCRRLRLRRSDTCNGVDDDCAG